MYKFRILVLLFLINTLVFSQSEKKVFEVENPNYKISPHTGMTKQHWKDAALYLLDGAFSYINTLDDAMKFPKQSGKTYPNLASEIPTEKLEGLCRTLFVAAPLLKENPALVVNNINVSEYYRHQIVKLIDLESDSYIIPRAIDGNISQNLVEFGALAVSLLVIPNVLWEPLTKAQKDALANTMLSYADGPTVPSNWKFFNIFVMSFFKQQGYAVNEPLLEEYLQKSLDHYRGNGWYNDNPAYDYYSMWAFQMYGMVWSEFFGKEYYPKYASKFQENFKNVKSNYPFMFGKDGKMIMWGRSISYRIGAIVPFPLMGFEDDSNTNFGWMRRISSSVIKQFLQHPDFLKDNIPTLGFYGEFEPAVQNYSCRGSVFWMGKAFLGLLVPDENPFWKAIENNGVWETEFKKDNVYNKFQGVSEILITDYPNIGASEIRAWCHEKVEDDWQKYRSTENYNRLSYNSSFPWQADGKNGEVAMNYVFKNKQLQWEALRLFTFKKFENGIYYRDAVLETNENIKLNLADVPLPNGILRVDKNSSSDDVLMHLGHYALPKLNEEIKTTSKIIKGHQIKIINNGKYQLAMIPVLGWDTTEIINSVGLHPESNESTVLNVTTNYIPNKDKTQYHITLMLWKNAGEKFTKKELYPIKDLKFTTNKVIVFFKDGSKKEILFN